jgi:AAA family ATP:ADP antiporter
VLPASIGFFVLYGKLVSALPERAVFYAAVAPLLAAYALFAAVVYPAAPALHFDLSAVAAALPAGLHGLVKVFANWTYSAFFCAAELWGSVVISVLFWSLANDTVTVDEAKVVYPFMAIGANVALVAGGVFVRAVNAALPAGAPLLGMRVLVGAVVAMSAVMFAAKAFIDARILAPMEAAAAAAAAKEGSGADGAATGKPDKKEKKEKKKEGSFAESIAVLRSSPKIGNLALLVMGYGVAHRLFEFAWKGQLRVLHPTVQGYQSVLADVSTYTGAFFVLFWLGWLVVFVPVSVCVCY